MLTKYTVQFYMLALGKVFSDVFYSGPEIEEGKNNFNIWEKIGNWSQKHLEILVQKHLEIPMHYCNLRKGLKYIGEIIMLFLCVNLFFARALFNTPDLFLEIIIINTKN